jgi:ketosteroid isomerase-like protein
MSQENISLVRDLTEAVSSVLGPDPEVFDRAFRDYADERFELHLPADYPEGGQIFRGREGMRAYAALLRETWQEWGFVPEQFLDADDNVVVFARLVARGHESGVPVELETNHVWTIRDGRATSMQVFRDRSEALEAVGLRE